MSRDSWTVRVCLLMSALSVSAGIYCTAQPRIPQGNIHEGNDTKMSILVGEACNRMFTYCIPAIIVSGEFSSNSSENVVREIEKALKNEPRKYICLESNGGDIQEASKVAKFISDQNLNTCISDTYRVADRPQNKGQRFTVVCASACTYVLLAGQKRIAVGNNFAFGLHANRSQRLGANDSEEEIKGRAFTAFRSIVKVCDSTLQKIIDAAFLTDSRKVYYLSPEEQMVLGFFTSRVGGPG